MNTRQRKKQLKKNGDYISLEELCNFDKTIAKFLVPRLKQFRKNTVAFPCNVDNLEGWLIILDKMIIAFEYIIHEDDWWKGTKIPSKADRDKRQEVIDEGLDLFAKYFQSLWW